MAVVLDSNVVVGFLDRSDHLHEVADEEVRARVDTQRLFVSVITYAEVLTGARLGHHDERQVLGFFADLVSQILPVDLAIADTATALRARSKALQMPAALIAASADGNPAVDLFLSGDRGVARLSGLDCTVRLLGESSS